MKPSERVRNIPPYLFAEISRKISEARKRGVEVISLGIGDPDLPTPDPVIEELCRRARDPESHRYPDYEGMPAFRQAVAGWYKRRHAVLLEPETEVLALIGAKEGSLHAALATVNPGDYALVPEPAYTPYRTAVLFASGIPHTLPLTEERGFLPDLGRVPREIARKSKLLFINYPNNPTSAVATRHFYREVVDFASDSGVAVVSDNPYSEIVFDVEPLSFLEVKGAKDVGIELNSLSKPYNMTGWRIGMACGNEEMISAMKITKNNVDSGVFNAVQYAGIRALALPDKAIDGINSIYRKRRDLALKALAAAGIQAVKPKATFYIWCRVPKGHTSASFAGLLLDKAGVVVTPGAAYGKYGEGYFRISLTVPDSVFEEAVRRIQAALKKEE